jgi:Rrf2 family protein
MSRIVQLSEASTIGLHSMVLIARSKDIINVNKISDLTGASKNHLAKVMQRLVKAGFLKSTRGPTGGFVLKKQASEITILNIYEAIEGVIETSGCPMDQPICPFDKCLLGNIIREASENIRDNFKNVTLQDYL